MYDVQKMNKLSPFCFIDVVAFCNTFEEEHDDFMIYLFVFLSTLERMLDTILQQEEDSQPLRLPSPEEYW